MKNEKRKEEDRPHRIRGRREKRRNSTFDIVKNQWIKRGRTESDARRESLSDPKLKCQSDHTIGRTTKNVGGGRKRIF